MNPLLDTVEPDAWQFQWEELGHQCHRNFSGEVEALEFAVRSNIRGRVVPLYSSPKVESLLAECRKEARKEALLEAINVCKQMMHTTTRDGYNLACSDICDEFRRMAEGEK